MAAGASGAVAGRLVTSKDIKNGTIQAADLSPSLKKSMGKPGPAGPVGPPGPTGASGAPGPQGVPETGSVRSWTVTFTSDGTTTGLTPDLNDEVVLATSEAMIPAHTAVQGLSAEITSGDISACTWGFATWATLSPAGSYGGSFATYSTRASELNVSRIVYPVPSKLTLRAGCQRNGANFQDRILPLPSFTVRYTFSTTPLPTAPVVPIN